MSQQNALNLNPGPRLRGLFYASVGIEKRRLSQHLSMEPRSGFEPETPSLPWKCSTTELSRHEARDDARMAAIWILRRQSASLDERGSEKPK